MRWLGKWPRALFPSQSLKRDGEKRTGWSLAGCKYPGYGVRRTVQMTEPTLNPGYFTCADSGS